MARRIILLALVLLGLGGGVFWIKKNPSNPISQVLGEKLDEGKNKATQILGEEVVEKGSQVIREKTPDLTQEKEKIIETIKTETEKIIQEKTQEIKTISQEETEKIRKEVIKEVRKGICEGLLKEE